jgi:hypothetical protein
MTLGPLGGATAHALSASTDTRPAQHATRFIELAPSAAW